MGRAVKLVGWSLAVLIAIVTVLGAGGAYWANRSIDGGALRKPVWSCLHAKDTGLKHGNGTIASADRLLAARLQRYALPDEKRAIWWHAAGGAAKIGLSLAYSADERMKMAAEMVTDLPDCPSRS